MKITEKMLKMAGLIFASAFLMLSADAAFAAYGIAQQVQSFNQDMQVYKDMILDGMFIAGIASAGMAAFKFKEHSENPQNTKLSKPLIYLLASGLLVGLPAIVNLTSESVTGQSANVSNTRQVN